MQRSLTSVALAATAVAFSSQIVSAGPVSVSVDGIPGAFMQWNVPLLNPGHGWTETFRFDGPDGSTRAWGTIEARCWNTGGWLILTDFGLESEGHARTLDFEFNARIEYGFSASWKNASQTFDADQNINSANASIVWTKGASWNGNVLPPLDGFYSPWDPLNSRLYGNSGRFMYVASPATLVSASFIQLNAGTQFDGVYLPDSALDIVPAPSSLGVVLGVGVVAGWRRRR